MGFKGLYITRTCFPNDLFLLIIGLGCRFIVQCGSSIADSSVMHPFTVSLCIAATPVYHFVYIASDIFPFVICWVSYNCVSY